MGQIPGAPVNNQRLHMRSGVHMTVDYPGHREETSGSETSQTSSKQDSTR